MGYEGCGSIAYGKLFRPVKLAQAVTVEALGMYGKPFKLSAKGMLAWLVQHENDHVNGVVFLDKISDMHKLVSRNYFIKHKKNNMYYSIFLIISSLLLVPAIFLVFIPAFPALWYMLFVASAFALFDGFVHISLTGLAILAGIVLLSMLVDTLSGIVGAKYGGASKKSIIYGFVGIIVGTVLFFPLGGLLGLFGGVLIAEFMAHRNQNLALKAATGSLIGTFVGMVINCILAISFLVTFLVFVL